MKADWWTPRLAGPVIAAAVVRFALLACSLFRGGTNAIIFPDTPSYLEPGRNLLLHGRFFADGVPDLLRTPGYSLFFAITSLGGLTVSAAANVILSVFSVILVWRLGRRVFDDHRIALGAAWIFAFEPIAVKFSVVLYSETLFLTCFLLSMERIAAFLLERRLRVLAVGGLWLAAATFVRPVSYYLPVALALGLFLVLARVPGLRWKAPAVLLITVLPWLAAWQIRNRVETGYDGFSSVGVYNLYFNDAAEVKALVEHRSADDVRNEFGFVGANTNGQQRYLYQPYLTSHPEQTGWSQDRRLNFMHSEAMHIIRAHYWVYLHTCVVALFQTVADSGFGSFEGYMNLRASSKYSTSLLKGGLLTRVIALSTAHPWKMVEKAAFSILLLGLYLFAARGTYLAARGVFRSGMCNSCVWLLLGTSLYFFAVAAAGSRAGGRFRLPVMPVVCILASAGFRRGVRTSGFPHTACGPLSGSEQT